MYEQNLVERVKRARPYFYNLVEEYDEKELYSALRRANYDFSYLEPFWQNLILKSEALEAKINKMPYNEKKEYIKKLDQERKQRREKVWNQNLSPKYKEFLDKIKKEEG